MKDKLVFGIYRKVFEAKDKPKGVILLFLQYSSLYVAFYGL